MTNAILFKKNVLFQFTIFPVELSLFCIYFFQEKIKCFNSNINVVLFHTRIHKIKTLRVVFILRTSIWEMEIDVKSTKTHTDPSNSIYTLIEVFNGQFGFVLRLPLCVFFYVFIHTNVIQYRNKPKHVCTGFNNEIQ